VATPAPNTPPGASAGARHWNRIISLPSAPHRAAAPCARAAALASSNRATARDALCTRNSASTDGSGAPAPAPAPPPPPHPDAKMSSTTRRDEWPSGSSAIVRNAEVTGGPGAGDGMNSAPAAAASFAFAIGLGFFLGRGRGSRVSLRLSRSLPIFFLLACWAYATASITSAAAAVAQEKGSGGGGFLAGDGAMAASVTA
jgi:hypothetical protein